jgi:hypothetical protein
MIRTQRIPSRKPAAIFSWTAVHIDPAARPFLAAIRFSNGGGSVVGHNGPSPVFIDEPVAPLW